MSSFSIDLNELSISRYFCFKIAFSILLVPTLPRSAKRVKTHSSTATSSKKEQEPDLSVQNATDEDTQEAGKNNVKVDGINEDNEDNEEEEFGANEEEDDYNEEEGNESDEVKEMKEYSESDDDDEGFD